MSKKERMKWLGALIGGAIGFGLFVASLEGPGMGNIIFRNGEFTPGNIWHYMKSPFREGHLWNPSLWSSNWVVMTGGGAWLGAQMC